MQSNVKLLLSTILDFSHHLLQVEAQFTGVKLVASAFTLSQIFHSLATKVSSLTQTEPEP